MFLGFALTPWLVNNHDNKADTAADLHRLSYLHIGLAVFQLILVLCGDSLSIPLSSNHTLE